MGQEWPFEKAGSALRSACCLVPASSRARLAGRRGAAGGFGVRQVARSKMAVIACAGPLADGAEVHRCRRGRSAHGVHQQCVQRTSVAATRLRAALLQRAADIFTNGLGSRSWWTGSGQDRCRPSTVSSAEQHLNSTWRARLARGFLC